MWGEKGPEEHLPVPAPIVQTGKLPTEGGAMPSATHTVLLELGQMRAHPPPGSRAVERTLRPSPPIPVPEEGRLRWGRKGMSLQNLLAPQ